MTALVPTATATPSDPWVKVGRWTQKQSTVVKSANHSVKASDDDDESGDDGFGGMGFMAGLNNYGAGREKNMA